MNDPLRLYTAYDAEKIPDWQLASNYLRPLPGSVVVEVLLAPEKQGSIFIPQRAQFTYHDEEGDPHAGFEPSAVIVLASYCNEDGVPVYKPGDIYLCHDGDGLCMEKATFGPYVSQSEVRMLGLVFNETDQVIESLPIEESLVAKLHDENWVPDGQNILIERKEAERKTFGGIYLPDVVNDAPCEGKVLDVGSKVQDVKVGDWVVYHPLGKLDFYEPTKANWVMVREDAIFTVVEVAA